MDRKQKLLLKDVCFIRDENGTYTPYIENINRNKLKNILTDNVIVSHKFGDTIPQRYSLDNIQYCMSGIGLEALLSQYHLSALICCKIYRDKVLHDRKSYNSFEENIPVEIKDIERACRFLTIAKGLTDKKEQRKTDKINARRIQQTEELNHAQDMTKF